MCEFICPRNLPLERLRHAVANLNTEAERMVMPLRIKGLFGERTLRPRLPEQSNLEILSNRMTLPPETRSGLKGIFSHFLECERAREAEFQVRREIDGRLRASI